MAWCDGVGMAWCDVVGGDGVVWWGDAVWCGVAGQYKKNGSLPKWGGGGGKG